MGQLKVNGTVIPYELVFSLRAKKISARIRSGQLKITVPQGLAEKRAKALIEAAKEQIFRLWQKALAEEKPVLTRRYEEGECLPFLDQILVLRLGLSQEKTVQIQTDAQSLTVSLPSQVSVNDYTEVIVKALEAWYKAQAREILWNKLDKFAALMGVEYRQFRLKDQKTRWGSCSAQGNINLNWRVILAPERVADYLVVHELAHLRHLNHSSDFWHVVETYLPDYRSQRSWLKKHGRELVL